MAFNSAPGRAEYTATAGQTVFAFVFKIFLDGDIKVYQTPAGQTPDDIADLLALTTDYTVSIDGDSGGEITLVSGASINDSITLQRSLEIDRLIEYQTSGDLRADTINDDQDYQTYLIADREAIEGRQLKLPESVQGVSTDLPAPVALNFLQWNSNADALENINSLQADGFLWTAADVYTKSETYSRSETYSSAELDTAVADRRKLYAKESATITPDADSDYTLTTGENLYGKLTLVDGSWTSAHNIILDNSIGEKIVDNTAGSYTATVKTSGGTGIDVLAGTTRQLYNDGTNVINVSLAVAKANLNASGAAPIYATRAWVNFNGTGAVAINASGNVSSITDVTTGSYIVNFLTNIEDVDYEVNGTHNGSDQNLVPKPFDYATGSISIRTSGGAGSGTGVSLGFIDPVNVNISINR
jgi:hypothetical protein